MKIEIKDYKVTPDSYLRLVNKAVIGDYWITPTTVYVILLWMSFVDIRYLILMLMLTVVLVPLYISYLYIWHGLKPESRYSIMNKSVVADDSGFALDFGESHSPVQLTWEEFKCFRPTQNGLILHFMKSKYLYFVLPYSAFDSKEQLDSLVDLVRSHLSSAGIDED